MEVRERKLSNHRVFSMSSDEIDAIVRSNPKVIVLSKENTLFLVFAHFLLSCLYFLLVLVLLKFQHGKGPYKGPVEAPTSVPKPLLL